MTKKILLLAAVFGLGIVAQPSLHAQAASPSASANMSPSMTPGKHHHKSMSHHHKTSKSSKAMESPSPSATP